MSLRLPLLLAYPPLAHLAVTSGSRPLTAAALILLAVVMLYSPLRQGRVRAWWALAALAAGSIALACMGVGLWLMVALSLGLPGVALLGFIDSLRPGHTPLITIIASRLHDPLPAPLRRYTRSLTLVWALIITVLMSIELGLIVFDTPNAWSRYANGYAYLMIAAVFVIEYGYRRLRFRDLPQPGLNDYVAALLASRHPQAQRR